MNKNRQDEIIEMLSGFIEYEDITSDDIDIFTEYIDRFYYIMIDNPVSLEKLYYIKKFLHTFYMPSELLIKYLVMFYYRETGLSTMYMDMKFLEEVIEIFMEDPESYVDPSDIEFMILAKSLDIDE